MIPDYLIYDELKKQRSEREWEPEALELPLYAPEIDLERDEEDVPEERRRGVIIIDMNTGNESRD